MATWIKIILGLVMFTVALAAVLLIRTWQFSPTRSAIESTVSIPDQKITLDEQAAAQRLAGALRFKTISMRADQTEYNDQFEGLHAYLRKTYPTVFAKLKMEKIARHGLMFKWQGSDNSLKPILLMSHQDVVPIAEGTMDQWEHPPFDGVIQDGFIWGRGTLDIKSGVLSILEAAETLLKQGHQPKRTIYFFFGDDEEIGGKAAEKMAAQFKQDNIHFDYVLDEGSVVLNDAMPSIKTPIAFISVAEKGYIDLQLSTVAAGGHSSMPPPETAIGVISRAIDRLQQNPFPAHITEIQRKMLYQLTPHLPFTERLAIANMWLFKPVLLRTFASKNTTNAAIRTTTAPTIFNAGVKENVLPINAKANVNFRILPGDTAEYVIKRVKTVIDDESVEITPGPFYTNPAPISSTDSNGYQTISAVITKLFGENNIIIAPYLTVGATDSRHFIPVSDDVYRFMVYRLDLADVKRIHGTNERLSIENFGNMIRFYVYLMGAS